MGVIEDSGVECEVLGVDVGCSWRKGDEKWRCEEKKSLIIKYVYTFP